MRPKRDSSAGRHLKKSKDFEAQVWPARRRGEPAEIDERQCRERLAEYFALLREWDLKLRQKDSESEST